jgi:hypothetical protein
MAEELERILDKCIDRLNRGETLRQCLDDYPEHATELEPLLLAMTQAKEAFPFTPSADARRTARQRFYAALDKQRRPALWRRVVTWRQSWAAAATVMVALILLLTLLPSSMPIGIDEGDPLPSGLETIVIPYPSSDGNFAFMVSDEENDIGDFSSLYITVDKVVLLMTGGTEQLVEFRPEVKEFDLTLLPGDQTLKLWQGDIPEGRYTKIFLYVTEVRGILKDTQEEIFAKLPSGKLQLNYSFSVTEEATTGFIFDITVVKAGQGSEKYLLKPQASESGITETPLPSKGQGKDKS